MDRDLERATYWDKVSESYDKFYVSRFSRQEDSELRRWLVQAIHSHKTVRILDVGCGTGLGLALLQGEAKRISYVGMDISEGMISRFRSKVGQMPENINVELKVGDGRHLCRLFPSNSFDLIMLINAAASYAGGPTQLMRNAQSILCKNGLLFASFLNRHALRRLMRKQCGIVETYNTRGADEWLRGVRTVTVSSKELERRCARVGLEPKWIRYQSVLGGVWEADLAAFVERVATAPVRSFGHTINLLAQKS